MVVFDFITRQMELHYFPSKVSLDVTTRNQRNVPQRIIDNFFCIGCQIVRSNMNLFINNQLLCEFINKFRYHSECFKGTHILTRNVNRQGLLIRIPFDLHCYRRKPISYNSKLFLQCDLTKEMLRQQKSVFILFSCNEHQIFRDVNNNYF